MPLLRGSQEVGGMILPGINSPGVQMYRRGKKKETEREKKKNPVKNVNTGRQESKGKKWAIYLLSGFELMQLSCFF